MSKVLQAMGMYPWAIQRQELDKIIAIATRCNDIEAVRAKIGKPLNNDRKTEVRDGIAIIPINGSIFRYANLFTEVSGGTSTQKLAIDFNQAMADNEVKGIMFDIDSGGGQANGISELSDMIFNAKGTKPIKTYIGGSGASAAYWIGSATDEVIINTTGMAGSIGAMLTYDDDTKKLKSEGIKEVKIISSVSPLKNADSELQSMVDTLGQLFVEDVAKNRNVSVDTVLEKFGKGGLFIGRDAVSAGLADRVGTFEDVLSSFKVNNKTLVGSNIAAKNRNLKLQLEE